MVPVKKVGVYQDYARFIKVLSLGNVLNVLDQGKELSNIKSLETNPQSMGVFIENNQRYLRN